MDVDVRLVATGNATAQVGAVPNLLLQCFCERRHVVARPASGSRVSYHHKILDYLESYHGGTGRTRGARTLREGKSLIFPMRSGKPISMSTLRKMLRHHRIASVAHGFRSSLLDWTAEETATRGRCSRWRWRTWLSTSVEVAYAWKVESGVKNFKARFPVHRDRDRRFHRHVQGRLT